MAGKKSPNKGGRPGVTREAVADAVDAWVANHGRAPSLRELRTSLGSTGSLTTLGKLLPEVLADRLLDGTSPDRGSVEETLIKSMKAAMTVLAADAATAADDAISSAVREADDRVKAAQALQTRAESREAKSALERERALGRVSALEELNKDITSELKKTRKNVEDAASREKALSEKLSRLEVSMENSGTLIQQLEQSQKQDQQRIQELEAALTSERDQHQQTQRSRDAAETAIESLTRERDAFAALQPSLTEIQETLNLLKSATRPDD